jgi:hypothetical protein
LVLLSKRRSETTERHTAVNQNAANCLLEWLPKSFLLRAVARRAMLAGGLNFAEPQWIIYFCRHP